MLSHWLQDIESLEAITQDVGTRELVLRLAELSRAGSIEPFLFELDRDADLDPATKATCAELALNVSFLNAFEDYVHRTRKLH